MIIRFEITHIPLTTDFNAYSDEIGDISNRFKEDSDSDNDSDNDSSRYEKDSNSVSNKIASLHFCFFYGKKWCIPFVGVKSP